MSRRSTRKNKTYFLSCRDTTKAVLGLSHHQANDINLTLVELDDVIEIVRLSDKHKAKSYRISVSPRRKLKGRKLDARTRQKGPNVAFRQQLRAREGGHDDGGNRGEPPPFWFVRTLLC